MKFTLNALGIIFESVFVKWQSGFKLCEFGESVDGLVYDDKLGYRCLPLLYWFCWCLQVLRAHPVQKSIGNMLL